MGHPPQQTLATAGNPTSLSAFLAEKGTLPENPADIPFPKSFPNARIHPRPPPAEPGANILQNPDRQAARYPRQPQGRARRRAQRPRGGKAHRLRLQKTLLPAEAEGGQETRRRASQGRNFEVRPERLAHGIDQIPAERSRLLLPDHRRSGKRGHGHRLHRSLPHFHPPRQN